MKKQAIAGAVLGLFSSITFAQAAQSTGGITIYGVADVGLQFAGSPVQERNPLTYDYEDVKLNKVALSSGQNETSRLGFRGAEDLGGGLNAFFQLEGSFDVTTGKSYNKLFDRAAFVGLGGGFGKLILGRQTMALDNLTGQIDPFGNGLSPAIGNLFAIDFVDRSDNAVRYETPVVSGLSGAVMYGFGEVPGDNSAGRNISVEATYTVNRLFVGVGYQKTPDAFASQYGPEIKRTDWMLGAKYNLGTVIIHGGYGQTKFGGEDDSLKSHMLGLTLPFGSHKFMASYVLIKQDDANAQQFGAGYIYDMSRRTALYFSVAKIKNNDKGNAGINGAQTVASVGITHKF